MAEQEHTFEDSRYLARCYLIVTRGARRRAHLPSPTFPDARQLSLLLKEINHPNVEGACLLDDLVLAPAQPLGVRVVEAEPRLRTNNI